jgi:lysophospholipase L1-like esterase
MMKTNPRCLSAIGLVGLLAFVLVPRQAPGELVPALTKPDATIAFMGDSITQAGAGPLGYVSLVMEGLATNNIQAAGIKAGISGHKSNNMLARLERDVTSHRPALMTLSCGVNDVWHGANGVPLPAYRTNITAIVSQAQAAGIEVVILTATMIKEDPENDLNAKLAGYNTFLRELAAEKKCRLADVSEVMIAQVKAARAAGTTGNILTSDGVHMNPQGNRMMATCLLRTLGLDDAQLARATAAWDRLAAAEAAAAMKRAEARRTAEAARKAEEEARKGTQPQKAAEKTMQDVTGAR